MNREETHNQPPGSPAAGSTQAGTDLVREFDCKDVAAVMSGLIDDVLDAQTRHVAERHIALCTPCADRIDSAERLNDVLADSIHVTDELPDGFAEAVLASTTRRVLPFRQPRWVAWSGWMAAAATFALAASLFFFENNAPAPQPGGGGTPGRTTAMSDVPAFDVFAPRLGSQVRGNTLPKRTGDAEVHTVVNIHEARPGSDGSVGGGAPTVDVTPRDSQEVRPAFTLSMEDEDTLYATARVLDMLFDFELSSLAVAERMRDIIVYDELLGRLARTRHSVKPEDRMRLSAAESMLYRVANGPVSVDDLQTMREDAERMDLIRNIERMIGHTDPDHSM